MRLSTRNQLTGTITEVMLASITKDAAEDLGLEAGKAATVLIKSTEVAIGVE
ncbi:MAG: putative molybdenum-pterin-binding protein [Mycobacterium sp.]|jgi:molybdopterin-binding protein|nr:putative molybdenum-pterin-binding protein [Mycobacterium sp.]